MLCAFIALKHTVYSDTKMHGLFNSWTAQIAQVKAESYNLFFNKITR